MAASDSKYPLGPYKLVTVNNAPERAKRLIGRVVEEVKERYTIIHAGNADSKSFSVSLTRCHRWCLLPSIFKGR